MAKRTSSRSDANDTAGATAATPKPRRARAAKAGPRPEALDALTSESTSMGSEPSEHDIRLRAYQRYLERGGGNGMEFDDWVEAERELKSHKSEV